MNNQLDMSWGSPEFLHPYWKKDEIRKLKHPPMSYIYGSMTLLKWEIEFLHLLENNVLDPYKYNIVVGNGASQIISAAIYTLGKPVFAEAPYFSRFPILADFANQPWDVERNGTQIITLPNNPDGSIDAYSYTNNTILDLSYNWKQYATPKKYDGDIMIFSLSKATGHASTRIGWALVRDEEIAKKMTDFIEYNTAGVSIEAQFRASDIINQQLSRKNTVFKFGERVLAKRWTTILRMQHKFPFEILNPYKIGMFLYCKGKCPENIKSLNGINFGDSSDKFRLNIGCSGETFHRFIKSFK